MHGSGFVLAVDAPLPMIGGLVPRRGPVAKAPARSTPHRQNRSGRLAAPPGISPISREAPTNDAPTCPTTLKARSSSPPDMPAAGLQVFVDLPAYSTKELPTGAEEYLVADIYKAMLRASARR